MAGMDTAICYTLFLFLLLFSFCFSKTQNYRTFWHFPKYLDLLKKIRYWSVSVSRISGNKCRPHLSQGSRKEHPIPEIMHLLSQSNPQNIYDFLWIGKADKFKRNIIIIITCMKDNQTVLGDYLSGLSPTLAKPQNPFGSKNTMKIARQTIILIMLSNRSLETLGDPQALWLNRK